MKALIYRLTLVGLACGAIAGCSGRQETVTSQRQANWQKAAPNAMDSAQPEPDQPIRAETHFAAGQLFEKQGSLNRAIVQYRKVLETQPNHVAALNQLGMCYAKMGRHEDAQAALQHALQLDPNSASLHNNLGFSYIAQKRWTEAEGELRRALEIKSDFSRARINLGMVLAYKDRHDEALECFLAVLPEAEAYYNLGLLYRAQRHYREAAMAFEQALDLNPRYAAARQQLDSLKLRIRKGPDVSPNPALDPTGAGPAMSSAPPAEMKLVADLSAPAAKAPEERAPEMEPATQQMTEVPPVPAANEKIETAAPAPTPSEPVMAAAPAPQTRKHDEPPAPPAAVMAPRIEAALKGSEATIPFMGSVTTGQAEEPTSKTAMATTNATLNPPVTAATSASGEILPMYPVDPANPPIAAEPVAATPVAEGTTTVTSSESDGKVLYLTMTPVVDTTSALASNESASAPAAEAQPEQVAYQGLTGRNELVLPMYPIDMEIKNAPANAPMESMPMDAQIMMAEPMPAVVPEEDHAYLATSSSRERRPVETTSMKPSTKQTMQPKAAPAAEPQMGVMTPVP